MAKELATRTDLDEERVVRALAILLPLGTLSTSIGLGLWLGLAPAILVLAAGMLLGGVSYFWTSLRYLHGDAALPLELAPRGTSAGAVDALTLRKKMLVRALKDLDNERSLGKLEAADYEQLTDSYREELKQTLREIDRQLAPYRSKAEKLAKAHIERQRKPPRETQTRKSSPKLEETPALVDAELRSCPKCSTSNDGDAVFCKKCGSALRDDIAPDAEADKDGVQ